MSTAIPPDHLDRARQAAFALLGGDAISAAAQCAQLQAEDPNLDAFPAFVDLLTWALPRERLYPLIRALVDTGFANPRSFDLLASAAVWAGERQAARALTDPATLLSIRTVDPPDHPDLALLESELAANIEHYDQPDGRAIRSGARRNHLERSESPVLRALFERLWGAARAYIAGLPVDPSNPFQRARPAHLGMRAWSVVSGADTYHRPHLHATSWVNGVYYVAVPPVTADAERKPGWLRVGPPPGRGFGDASGWAERWVRPEPGLVVLMPSHFSHETVPLACDERRICVAFELFAAPERAMTPTY